MGEEDQRVRWLDTRTIEQLCVIPEYNKEIKRYVDVRYMTVSHLLDWIRPVVFDAIKINIIVRVNRTT